MPLRKKVEIKTKSIILTATDRAFSYNKFKYPTLRIVGKIQSRYAKHGETIEVAVPRTYKGTWRFMLDTPKIAKSDKKRVYVSGWFVPLNGCNKIKMRIKTPKLKYKEIKYGIIRSDVAAILRSRYKKKIDNKCGFGSMIDISEDGIYIIEANIDEKGWNRISRVELKYDLDLLTKDIFNPNLSFNMAEHSVLIESKKRYFHEKEIKNVEINLDTDKDPKLIAFYLPQFHPFPENDEWWGKGFTEWTNVTSAVPRFLGHEQPRLPADLGFYDLRYEDNILKQISLAKKHGIYGFCFYYYWFSGKRLLEGPLNSVITHKEWDFNFMICWANENWTRRWDGRAEDILIEQKHNTSDPLNFIKDVEHILLDSRYIRVDNKPVLQVYRAGDLDNPSHYVKIWRDYFLEKHNLELHLIAVMSFSDEDPLRYGFDKKLDFVPLGIASDLKAPIPSYDFSQGMIDARFTGVAYDYRKISLELPLIDSISDTYYSIMPSWDNDARKKGSGGMFFNSNPDLYGNWLSNMLDKKNNKLTNNMLFINAWNEWAEGTYLEPDEMYGHAYLNRTSQVLAANSNIKTNKDNFPMYGIRKKQDIKTAVVLHLFYSDMWGLFESYLNNLKDIDYDLFITIPAKNDDIKEDILKFKPDANIIITPNRGRDVLPFIHLARRLKHLGYLNLLKLHSKKSTHRDDGNLWMKDMLDKLLPKKANAITDIIELLDNNKTGIIGPAGHFVSLNSYYGSNETNIAKIINDTKGNKYSKKVGSNINDYGFFAGTMFWLNLDSIGSILDQFYQPSDFESESGQIDGTFAHAMERTLTLIPIIDNKNLYVVEDGKITEVDKNIAQNFNNYDFAKNE